MNNYTLKFTSTFKSDLKNTYYYISSYLQEPNIANNLYNKIMFKILALQYFPKRYPKLLNPNSNKIYNIRKLPVDKYIILYNVDSDTRSSFFTSYLSL